MSGAVISQSEADSFLSCERKHWYAFGEHLQAKTIGAGLTRGIVGHEALDAFYSVQMGVRNITPDVLKYAKHQMLAVVETEMKANMKDSDKLTLLAELMNLLSEYVDHYQIDDREWEVLAVEHEFRYGSFPFKPDMLKRNRRTGVIRIVDHKFLYNFYLPKLIEILPQMPKYVGALRELGYNVVEAEYNMLRHRKNAKEKFERIAIPLNPNKVAQYTHEQKVATQRIQFFKSLSKEEWESAILRNANSFTCGSCPFLDLCKTDLNKENGRDLLVKTFYEPNTYGYSETIGE